MSEFEDILCKFLLKQPSLDALLWHRLRTMNRRISKVAEKVPPTRWDLKVTPDSLSGLLILAKSPLENRLAGMLHLEVAKLSLQQAERLADLLIKRLYLAALSAKGKCILGQVVLLPNTSVICQQQWLAWPDRTTAVPRSGAAARLISKSSAPAVYHIKLCLCKQVPPTACSPSRGLRHRSSPWTSPAENKSSPSRHWHACPS